MKIDVLCSHGSSLGVTLKDLWGKGNRGVGIGGSEYALLTLCEGWHNAGHEVTLYNDPCIPNGSPFEQRAVHQLDPSSKRDVLVTFRTPNPKVAVATGLKVWMSCDQYTVGNFKHFAGFVDKIVVISPFHQQYFSSTYQIENTIAIDIPVRLDDILAYDVEREEKKCIFTSVPDRGLQVLREIWNMVQEEVPDVSLTITSDYRLWGVDQGNEKHRVAWMLVPNVTFLGAISRERLINEQLSAQLMTYPSIYDELFCVSVAEAQACGVYPITSNTGALATTNMGLVIHKDMDNYKRVFADNVIKLLNDTELYKKQAEIKKKAWTRFSVSNVLSQWDEKVFK